MKNIIFTSLISLLLSFFLFSSPEDSKIRPFHKNYGFADNKEQMLEIIKIATANNSKEVLIKNNFIAAICPHDDYAYTAEHYQRIISRVKTKEIIIIGVAHAAKKYNLENKLIFGNFVAWETYFGCLKTSKLRDFIIARLPETDYTQNPEFMKNEHSMEAFTHWIKHYNKGAKITPISIPYMDWNRTKELSTKLAVIIQNYLKANNLSLVDDVTVLISNDSSHYGDQGWGGKNYAPFGTDITGYLKATIRDNYLAESFLVGPIDETNLKQLLYSLVNKDDVYQYKITWCGRFSITFGTLLANILKESSLNQKLTGKFIKYDTSMQHGILEGTTKPLEVTAPANLHHWVAYLTMIFN